MWASHARRSWRSSRTCRFTPGCRLPAPPCGWRPTCSVPTELGLPPAQHHVGLAFGEGHELAPVSTPEALCDRALEHAPYGAGHRGGDVEGAPGLDDEAGILGGQLQGELRRPGAGIDGLG